LDAPLEAAEAKVAVVYLGGGTLLGVRRTRLTPVAESDRRAKVSVVYLGGGALLGVRRTQLDAPLEAAEAKVAVVYLGGGTLLGVRRTQLDAPLEAAEAKVAVVYLGRVRPRNTTDAIGYYLKNGGVSMKRG